MNQKNPARSLLYCTLAVAGALALPVETATAEASLPLKGGERILFIGNSLTGSIPENLNEIFKANNLPTFEGYRLQIWNQSLETHATISRQTHPELFQSEMKPSMDGYAVKGKTTLWKQGQYNAPRFVERGYILAEEAIRLGTPDGKPWDFIIFQEYNSDQPDNAFDRDGNPSGSFFTYGSFFIRLAREVGAVPMLYTRWYGNPESGAWAKDRQRWEQGFQRILTNQETFAKHWDVPVIPVGWAAYSLSADRKPDPALADGWLYSDNVHPSAFGRGVVFYTFASFLSQRPPDRLKIEVKDYSVGLADKKQGVVTPKLDQAIQAAVWKTLQERGLRTQ